MATPAMDERLRILRSTIGVKANKLFDHFIEAVELHLGRRHLKVWPAAEMKQCNRRGRLLQHLPVLAELLNAELVRGELGAKALGTLKQVYFDEFITVERYTLDWFILAKWPVLGAFLANNAAKIYYKLDIFIKYQVLPEGDESVVVWACCSNHLLIETWQFNKATLGLRYEYLAATQAQIRKLLFFLIT